MKFITNDFFKFITLLVIMYIITNILLTSPVYAMGIEELNDVDYDYCMKDENMCPKRTSVTNPADYWMNHPYENDAYAIKQKNIHLYNNHNYMVEPKDYPIKYNTSLKSKLFWLVWKKHTDNFDSASHFEQSIGKSYSIRSEFFKDLKRIFKK